MNGIADELYYTTKCHISFPLLPRSTSCQHQYLTSWESSRRLPEPPPAQSCGPLSIHHLQGRNPDILHLLSYTWHQPLARNQAFHQPVRYLSKPNTPAIIIHVYLAAVSHLHLAHGFSSPVPNNPALNLGSSTPQAQENASHHWYAGAASTGIEHK